MSATRTVEEHYGDLQIEYDEQAQRHEWRATAIALVVMAALLAASLAGVFGSGPLSHASAATPDGALRVEYERFMNFDTETPLYLAIQPSGRSVRLTVEGLKRDIHVAGVEPSPKQVIPGPGESRAFVFDVEPGREALVNLEIKPEQVGRLPLALTVDGGPAVRLTAFVLP